MINVGGNRMNKPTFFNKLLRNMDIEKEMNVIMGGKKVMDTCNLLGRESVALSDEI